LESNRLASLFDKGGYDAVVVLSPVNVTFLSGARILTQRLIPERLAIVLWPATSAPTFIICSIEETLVRAESAISDIRGYVEFKDAPVKMLADVIAEKGLQRGRIGLEKSYISADHFGQLCQLLPEATFGGCDRQLDLIRAIKSKEEIEILAAAAVATDEAIAAGYQSAKPGRDERFVAETMRSSLFQRGADELAFLCLGAGAHCIEAHHTPCSYQLEAGHIMRVDIGGSFSGYYSDLARTAVVGKPTSAQEQAYGALWDVMEEVIDAVKPTVPARQLYQIYKSGFEKRGLPIRMPHVGHSLGIKLHEKPMLMPYEDTVLQANMVLEIELVHVDAGNLYHNEDQVVVTDTGHKIVSRTRDWSRLFRIAS
jgi:Xaa-Pro dipeptidase